MRQLAILLASMTFPTLVLAQSPDVPMDLAKALLATRSPWDETQWVEIVVGGPPRQWRVEPLKDLRIIGSAAFASSATVVYAVDGDVTTSARSAVAQLEAAGWTLAPARERPASLESGFVPTDAVFSANQRRPLCKGDRAAMVNPLEMASGPRVLRVVYMGSESSALCNPPSPRAYRDPWENLPMPRLEAPAGTRVLTTGRGGGSDSFTSSGYAFTTMAVDKLLAHYGAQMAPKGWQPTGPAAVQKTTATQAWQLKHNGADWVAVMVISVTGDDMRDMELKMLNTTELSKRRGF